MAEATNQGAPAGAPADPPPGKRPAIPAGPPGWWQRAQGLQLVLCGVGVLVTGTMTVQFCAEAAQREMLLKEVKEDIQNLSLKNPPASPALTDRLLVILEGTRTLIVSGSTHPRMTARLISHAKWCVNRGKDPEAPSSADGGCECYNGMHAFGRQAPLPVVKPAAPVLNDCGTGLYWEYGGGDGGLPWESIMNFSSASLMAAAILCSALLGAFISMLRNRRAELVFQIPIGLGAGLVVWFSLLSASGLLTPGASGALNSYSAALLGLGAGLSTDRLFDWLKSWFQGRLTPDGVKPSARGADADGKAVDPGTAADKPK